MMGMQIFDKELIASLFIVLKLKECEGVMEVPPSKCKIQLCWQWWKWLIDRKFGLQCDKGNVILDEIQCNISNCRTKTSVDTLQHHGCVNHN